MSSLYSGFPPWMTIIPNTLGSMTLYSHEPTVILNTAKMDIDNHMGMDQYLLIPFLMG